jgi:7,8-dihydroneopterin aldolase/epimerase/oxygenase
MAEPDLTGGEPRLTSLRVFVRALTLDAEIGVHDHEHGRRQPLIIDVELEVAAGRAEVLSETVDYQTVVAHARAVAGEHIRLVETFVERLARRCMADPRVLSARVRAEKPEALAPDAAGAGAEITLSRTS